MSKLLQVVSSTFLFIVSPLTLAQAPTSQAALAWAFNDTQLKWGSCPAFMPQGCQIAVLHGDPAKPNADVFLKTPANSTIPDHWHTSAERMVLISGEMHVTYKGQKTTILKPGMYAYGPAKLPHKAFCAKGSPCVLFIAFELPVDAIPTESATSKAAPASTSPRLEP